MPMTSMTSSVPKPRPLRYGPIFCSVFRSPILVIVVAVPMLLIFFNAFWVDGHFNAADVVRVLKANPKRIKALRQFAVPLGRASPITGTDGRHLLRLAGHADRSAVQEVDETPVSRAVHASRIYRRAGLEDAALAACRLHQSSCSWTFSVSTARCSTSTVMLESFLSKRCISVPVRLHSGERSTRAHGSYTRRIGSHLGRRPIYDHPQDHDPAGDAVDSLRRAC